MLFGQEALYFHFSI